jgi:hypothetical protein
MSDAITRGHTETGLEMWMDALVHFVKQKTLWFLTTFHLIQDPRSVPLIDQSDPLNERVRNDPTGRDFRHPYTNQTAPVRIERVGDTAATSRTNLNDHSNKAAVDPNTISTVPTPRPADTHPETAAPTRAPEFESTTRLNGEAIDAYIKAQEIEKREYQKVQHDHDKNLAKYNANLHWGDQVGPELVNGDEFSRVEVA